MTIWKGGCRNEKDLCQDYPIFVWLSRKHEVVSGRGEVCKSVYYQLSTWRLLKKQLRFVHWLKQLAWELNHHNAPARCLIAPRVPAQFSQSVGVSRLSRTTTNISLAATLKEQVQILDVFVVPLEEDQRFPVKMIFCQRAKRHNLYCEALSSSRGNAFAQMTG